MTRLRRRGLRPGVLIAVTLTVLLLAAPARAQQGVPATPAATPESAGPEIVIQPEGGVDGDYFTLEAEPGSSHELTVILGNADDEPLSLRTFVNDPIPVTNGGFALADEDVTPSGTATWIDYPAETFDFAPGDGVERTFSVNVPAEAEPGQYVAGLALQTAEPMAVEGSDLFDQVIRKVVAVFIIVPGPEHPAFLLGEPAAVSGVTSRRIEIPVVNEGNVLVKPQGELTLVGVGGETVATVPVTMGSVYAGTTAPLSLPLPPGLAEGAYTVHVSLADSATGAMASLDSQTVSLGAPTGVIQEIAMTGEVSLQPDAGNPSFAGVALTISNPGEPVDHAEVVLEVARDGEEVEQFLLASSLALPAGDTVLDERYIPIDGFVPGTWTFVVRLNVIDPVTGAATPAAILDTLPPVTVGD